MYLLLVNFWLNSQEEYRYWKKEYDWFQVSVFCDCPQLKNPIPKSKNTLCSIFSRAAQLNTIILTKEHLQSES